MIELLFWLCAGIVFYAYFGYPLLLSVIAGRKSVSVKKNDITPSVTIIIAAYNEEKVIRKKIENSLSLEYPRDKLEIMVVSDGSTDSTDSIVGEYSEVKLVKMEKRSGKVTGHKTAVRQAKGEIFVFSDATGMYEKDALRKLVRHFADEKVGCVGGMLEYVDPADSDLGGGEGLYWKYEVMVRKLESRLGSLVAVSGSIYAVRKELYFDFPEKLADDLIIPLCARKKGYHVIYEPQALCIEETVVHRSQELSKRARIANQNIRGILYMKEMFNIFVYPVTAFILFSHKLLRQLIPVFMIFLFLLNILLISRSFVYGIIFVLQDMLYAAAVAGFIFHKDKKPKVIVVPYYFCTTNLGILLGLIKFTQKKEDATWEPER
ncbi:MAG: glycosyltransferase family 2 protein [Candidatus Omnitrophica bacterium]|nr:glycosyltransferase family 2 protein [Candidatus Omnitrophota bacterium]